MRNWLVLAAIGVLAGGCQVLSFTWVMPTTVPAGSQFTMVVTGYTAGFMPVGAVFQVPNGFTVLSGSATVTGLLQPVTPVRDETSCVNPPPDSEVRRANPTT